MLRIEDALAIVLDHVAPQPTERVDLSSAIGRTLHEPVIADHDLPPFDRARMDGYAFRAPETERASAAQPVKLREIGQVSAGECFDRPLGDGEAVRIMTGAPVPAGADAVERIEVIEVPGDGSIILQQPVTSGRNITPRGFEVRQGARVVESGQPITPSLTAVLATFGYSTVAVACRPRVAIISTGSELVEVGEIPKIGQIRDSNGSALAGYVRMAGAELVAQRLVGDDLDATSQVIAALPEAADVVLLTGGVSMGDYDLVKPALRQLDAAIHFERVAMHPGKPTVFATIGHKLIFGLPGNPVSVAVAFHLFVRPALMKMLGRRQTELPRSRAFCHHPVKGAPPRRSHQPGRLTIRDGAAVVEPLKWSGSGDLVGFMDANSLLVIPEDQAAVTPGELVEIILLP